MLFDATIQFIKDPEVVQTTVDELGFAKDHIVTIGILAFISAVFHAIPKISIVGAIALTGYLGGAVASNLRVDNPLFSHILIPVYIGILIWVGLWFRSENLRNLINVKRTT